jgi:hypothetical protein
VRTAAATLWLNAITGDMLDAAELAELRSKAHGIYAANGHIFEDEVEVLAALGALPIGRLVA